MKTVQDFDFKDKKALIRVDFNVPLNAQFQVTDATRIQAATPTITKILEDGGSCVLMSHLGRPKGVSSEFSLAHLVKTISEIIGVQVQFVNDCIGKDVEKAVANLKNGEILLLENLRFHSEEKAGDVGFAKALSKNGDIYVNDAFGTAHRAHASTAIIAQFFEGKKCFGKLMASEIEHLNKVLNNNTKPVTAVIGGAKVSSKIEAIKNIIPKVDNIIIGGGMAFTFLKVKGGNIGNSLIENDKLDIAQEVLNLATNSGTRIHLPIDVIAAKEFSENATTQIVSANDIPEGWMGLDVGPQTNIGFSYIIADSKTILWNGPMGVFEMPAFSKGTIEIGNAIADATAFGAFSLVGGGDSVAAVKQFGLQNKVSYVSTGGGAMLAMLEGKTLPGIEAMED